MLTKIFYHILGLLVAFWPAVCSADYRNGNTAVSGGWLLCEGISEICVTERVDMRLSDLLSVTDEMMDYLKGDRENLNVEAVIGGVQREFFNAKEKRHMQDVREAVFAGAGTAQRGGICRRFGGGVSLFEKKTGGTS